MKTIITLALALSVGAAMAGVGFWNGQMTFGQQGGQQGVFCGYNINGSTLTVFFPNRFNCPASL